MTLTDQPVLVTGATGLIGVNLIKRLLTEGAKVRATIHQRSPLIQDEHIEYVTVDLQRPEDCRRACTGQSLVFMCSGSTSGAAEIAATPMIHVTPNVIMNALMLEAAYAAGVRKFLWLGSTIAYPPTGDRPVKEGELLDGEPFEKYYFAGWMKRFTELLCRMYGEKIARPMTTIVLRPTNVYGPHDKFDPARSHVSAALLRKVVERQHPLEVWGTGDDVRDLIYVDDMVEAMILAMVRLESYAAINIGLGKVYSVKQVLQLLLDLDGYRDAEVRFDPSKPTMIPKRVVDTTQAQELLGFKAKVDLREGLSRTIEWYRQTRGLARM